MRGFFFSSLLLTEETIKKKEEEAKQAQEEEKRARNKEVGCFGHPDRPYMTLVEFNKYDLNNPPGLVSQFWIQHPDITVNMMIHWVISGITVLIPYKWHPSEFIHCNIYHPKKPKPEEKYVYLTMFEYVDMCREWSPKSHHRRYPMLKGKEEDRRYTPIIADVRKSLEKAQSVIEIGKERIYVLNKMVNKLKSKKAHVKEIREMISVWMDAKKTVAVKTHGCQQLKERLQRVEEKVEEEIEMRRNPILNSRSVRKKKAASRNY